MVNNTECGIRSLPWLTYHLSLCLKANNIIVNNTECRLQSLPRLIYHLSLRLEANNIVENTNSRFHSLLRLVMKLFDTSCFCDIQDRTGQDRTGQHLAEAMHFLHRLPP